MATYQETEFLLPKTVIYILIAMLAASDVFIFICTQLNIGTDMWMFGVSTIIFLGIIAVVYFVRLKISIDDKNISVGFIKKTVIPLDDVIDYKIGDIDVIRNYSGWGMKNVKFRNFICHGYENGISFKVAGRLVVTMTTGDPEAMAAAIPKKEV